MVVLSMWLAMGLLLLIGNIIVELDESKEENHLNEDAGPE